jgi:hypothetical protein
MFRMAHLQKLMLILVCAIGVARADGSELAMDLGRSAAGVAVLGGTISAASHAMGVKGNDILTMATNPTILVAGAALAFPFTTYGRSLRAQWDLWFWFNQKLVAITMADYDNDDQLCDALVKYYVYSKYPLLDAHTALGWKHYYLDWAASTIEAARNDMSDGSARAQDFDKWFEEVSAMRDAVAHAVAVIIRNPQWSQTLQVQNMANMAQAIQAQAQVMAAQAMVRPQVTVVYDKNNK